MTAKKLGIWMDHDHAHLTEFTAPIETKTLVSEFTHELKEQSMRRGENHMHIKEQHQEAAYYKKLGELIKKYDEVLLYGPTHAKDELFNFLAKNHSAANVKIHVEHADKMTENQRLAFVLEYFTKHG